MAVSIIFCLHYSISSHCQLDGPLQFLPGYPFQPRKSHDSDYVREYLHLRSRTKSFASLLRLRSFMTQYTHQYFHQQGFVNIHTPILTSNDCEGAGEVFTVIPDSELTPSQEQINKDKNPMRGTSSPILDPKETFFGEKAYLTVSGQLHLEAMARSLSKVYTLNPTFRAENSKSRLHLAEFYMIEAELAFLDNIHDLCNTIEQFIKSVLNRVLESHEEELLTYRKLINLANITDLQCIHDNPFIRMSYSAAVTILTRHGFDVNPDSGLSKQHELFLVKYTNNVPIFIINWPKHVKPFYMKRSGEDPDQVLAVDLLCPLVGEVCGGGLREDDYSILQSTLYEQGLQEKLDWYLELRKFGNVPTGGFGVGLERFVQVVLGQENIKDVIPYPRYPHHCKLYVPTLSPIKSKDRMSLPTHPDSPANSFCSSNNSKQKLVRHWLGHQTIGSSRTVSTVAAPPPAPSPVFICAPAPFYTSPMAYLTPSDRLVLVKP
ncbi:probable asparagine--tRNA ligase, mitochondrial [Diaphorina citri]|uniref:asparagine--tRNA ligase n=1 Tax=Diaphorina citri TaxID=121845 RepID=A0A3Q0IXG8_DIACI|nr:probable asparagine--tRNA ligase, mitochondrial [Diaphorina citri]